MANAAEETESKDNTNVESVTESAANVEVKVEQEEVKDAEEPVTVEEKKELAIEDKGKATKEQIEEVRLGKFYSVKQVATSLGFSTAYISYLLAGDQRNGIPPRIHGVKVLGGSWRIPESEYERLTKEGPLPLKKPGEDKQVTRIQVEGEPEERVVEGKGKSTIKKLKAEEKPDKWPHIRINLLNIK